MITSFRGLPVLDFRYKYLLFFLLLITPVLLAIWIFPWFVTQDGPLHLYNAYILKELSKGNPAFDSVYMPQNELLPYTGTYRILSGLMSFVSARTADRIMMTCTSIGLALSILWLRRRISGWNGMAVIIPLVLLLSFSRLWVFGLYGFLLGASIFPLVLGSWWKWRDNLSPFRVLFLGILLIIGYFLHLISTGITIVALIIFAITTPGPGIKKRLVWTVITISPPVYLIIRFISLMMNSSGGGLQWHNLNNPLSMLDWAYYLQAIDFITISFKSTFLGFLELSVDCPFKDKPAIGYLVFEPSIWAMAGVLMLITAVIRGRIKKSDILHTELRGWILLVCCLFFAGLFGPSAIGGGSLLRERFLLLGIVALVPLLRMKFSRPVIFISGLFLSIAVLIQIAFILDYARISNSISCEFMEAEAHIKTNQRIALVVPDSRTHYLAHPLPNLVNQLGIGSDSVVWNNYGPAYYYFPVSFRDSMVKDRWERLNKFNGLVLYGDAEHVAVKNPDEWVRPLTPVMNETDILILWGNAPWLENIDSEWFDPAPIFEKGRLRLFKHKSAP